MRKQKGSAGVFTLILLGSIFLFFVVLFTVPYGMTTISTTERGVKSNWGKIQPESLGDGLKFYNPIKSNIKKIDMRERMVSINTTTVSKEGLKFGVTVTVMYRVQDGKAVNLVKNLETELSVRMKSLTNSTIDDVATSKNKNEMYSDVGRVAIVKAVKDKLNIELGDYAVISQVTLEDITLPEKLKIAIEAQEAELEKIKQKKNEKQTAIEEAEIRRIDARGVADANNIIQKSLTREYLMYEAIQKMNPSAQKIYIPNTGMIPTMSY